MFGKNENYYQSNGAGFTAKEIAQQPCTWTKTYYLVKSMKNQIVDFLNKFDSDSIIYLTGAGTSEFVGNTIGDYINNLVTPEVRSIASANLVSNPDMYFKKDRKTLLVSFGRSGSSPESILSVNLANQLCNDVHHLIITCNSEGTLAKESHNKSNYLTIILPDETHDQSFAMTSSYTNMMLATILAFDIKNLAKHEKTIDHMSELTNEVIEYNYQLIDKLVLNFKFNRIVYLGSGTLKGMAQESALKILELSSGLVATMFDSPLGFRHGPKSIIQKNALTVVFLSDNEYTRSYEVDLLKEMLKQKVEDEILVVTNKPLEKLANLDYVIELKKDVVEDDMVLVFPFITVAQIIALKKSLDLNIASDNPCPTGEVNRVVKGVTVYEYMSDKY
ncbi:hypothetical protein CI105_06895 [Candidatus Izimaplasma bacterium ZiA1]|uniref:SIS domain-containing protein n=1 Tax=Candidatus Izimoplasma sp. ZiA1 TaxID=2024899 RepID=UPI000BAA4688|nr:hypothetical protein CI105_06895 [Candidatus Izimaplasma bacterium ZiA1]